MKKLSIITGRTGQGKSTRLNEFLKEQTGPTFFVGPIYEMKAEGDNIETFETLEKLEAFMEATGADTNNVSLFVDEFTMAKKNTLLRIVENFKDVFISQQGTFEYGLDLYRDIYRTMSLKNTEVSISEVKRDNWN